MNLQITPPPDEMLAAFARLEETLGTDTGGAMARRMAQWFVAAELQAREHGLRCTDFEQRRQTEVVAEAMAASRRALAAVWSKKHGAELGA